MNWRLWAYTQLSTNPLVLEDVSAAAIHGAGSLDLVPRERPFVMIIMSSEFPGIRGDDLPIATNQSASVVVHDQPGDYQRIDRVLGHIREALDGSIQVLGNGGICAQWQGVGPDGADDLMGTISKSAEFKLVGRVNGGV